MNSARKRILIIEDHESIRLLLGTMLSKSYEVITTKDGLEGMAWLVKGNLPDLILLDMSMPRLSGDEFLRNIRQSGFFRDIPVIVVSGNDGEEDVKNCLRWGVDDYLTKPFNPISLKKRIENVLYESDTFVLN
ncbi:MAG: response regulator [Saprospiraceae bacterium]|nr:response regulator [Saprospiraceae bacterium]MCF8251948.1 response regulator [Saprospiraceae bacterium]MCF8282910.1 response regulator [Bacteroidales bacterium]MCF8313648.1 response regulator [Saprospiraceae bacterium]MCF8442355.1 response regulator [Saprospiraceae bacterium]